MSLSEELIARLEELGVATTEAEADELASVQPALEEWMQIASDLAREEET